MSERENIARLYQSLDGEDQQTTILALILERQDLMLDKISAFERNLQGHMEREEGMLKQIENAFPKKPEGDPDFSGHRDYHSALIEESKSRAAMWRELRVELLRKGLWGLIGVIVFLAMYWWNREVKHG